MIGIGTKSQQAFQRQRKEVKLACLQISKEKRGTEAQRRFEIKRPEKKGGSADTNGMRAFLEDRIQYFLYAQQYLNPVPTLQNRHRHVTQSDVGKQDGVGTIWSS